MKILHTYTLENICIVAIAVFGSIVIARYVNRSLLRMIEKDFFGPLTADRKKSLLRIPDFLRIFIMTRGCMIAFSQLHFQPAFLELASAVETIIVRFGNVFIFLCLIIVFRTGFDIWAARVLKAAISNDRDLTNMANNPLNSRIRKSRTLVNLLLSALGLVIFLPYFALDIPQEQILYAAYLFLLAIGGWLVFLIKNIQKKAPDCDTKKTCLASPDLDVSEAMGGQNSDFQIIVSIVKLFLKILQHYLGAEKDSPCRFTLVEHDASVAKYLFDLEVHLYGSWKKRRMTIGRLAADSGSRSKCFYVIYDEYLVVKVPPEPIVDPTEYIESLNVEAAIVRQLDMEECLIPVISVILKFVDPSINARASNIDSPEELYKISLQPDLYQFLKVGETFAYFMDMSKYYFLQDVIKMLHDISDKSNKVPFLRIKAPLEGIVANLLDLLAHIGDRGVSLRDLKPDNMLVAGDRNNYPNFLNNPEEYVVGLIDIETAVVFGDFHWNRIDQPRLGGTPQYATPSHFFTNDLIHHLYDDVADILHLQDWHGIISVIFKVITNHHLFKKTARTIPGIVHGLNSLASKYDVRDFAVKASRLFWRSAEAEFKEKMAQKSEVMCALMIPVAEPAVAMFMERISAENHGLTTEIKELITTQSLYPTDTNRQKLLKASSREIEKLSRKWEKLPKERTDLLKRQPQVVQLLQDLWKIKLDIERQEQLVKLLSNPEPKIPASLLLESMFSIVSRRMYLRRWKELPDNFDDEIAFAINGLSEKNLEGKV